MADSFLDTSALVKYSHREEGTQEVTRIIAAPNSRLCISRLSLVETVNAFAVKFRTRDIDEQGFEALRRRFYYDIGRSLFRIMPVTTPRYQEATQLLEKHFRIRLRTLGALQLAIALVLAHQGLIEHFVCADRRLCETAREEGLSVIRPSGE
jgi:predicted nucleic acid-binding protein